MGRLIPLAALLLAACGSPELPPAATAEAIDQAVINAEREMATARARTSGERTESLVGA